MKESRPSQRIGTQRTTSQNVHRPSYETAATSRGVGTVGDSASSSSALKINYFRTKTNKEGKDPDLGMKKRTYEL